MRPQSPFARASRILAVAAFASALLLPLSSAVALDTSQRSASEIQARWQQLQPACSGSIYSAMPRWSAPYAAGSLAPQFLQDGLNSMNYVRYLAGLPSDVTLDAADVDKAQHGAVLLAAGQFAHSQPKPSDMSQAFYDIANRATNSSNIGWGYLSLADFNLGCMDDGDTGNIDRVGHRRWILNPPLLKTGMGYADGRSDTLAFDESRASAVSYDSVKWPSAGPFPAELFNCQTPWSVTLNPSRYSWTAGTAGHTVTLRRRRDGKVWTFTSADTNKSGEYFNFETSGYGVSNCFIFRPAPASVGSYEYGDVFDVTISGGIKNKADGRSVSVSYSTEFIPQAPETSSSVRLPGTLVGTVLVGGVPLAGASVSIGSMGAVTTGADGSYQVPNVNPGCYAVVYSKPGYVTRALYSVTIAEEATTTQPASLCFKPSITRTPFRSVIKVRRRRGAARYTLSAVFGGVGARLAGSRVYLQASKNGKTGWKNVSRLTTNSSGRASRALTKRKRTTIYYRWHIGSTSASVDAASSRQKVVIR